MRIVVVTGLSGAGKSTALHALEDIGYFSSDNVPPHLWLGLVNQAYEHGYAKVALGVDMRTRAFLSDLGATLSSFEVRGLEPEIVYLEAKDDTLIQRYNLTRRTHPLGRAPLKTDIASERQALGELRSRADMVIETSTLSAKELVTRLQDRFSGAQGFLLRVISFGFKRGIPSDADNVFDLRGLPNPYYDAELKVKDGRDEKVKAYVFTDEGLEFYEQLRAFIATLLSQARKSRRGSYTVAVGCTGGQHRSVAVAERLGLEFGADIDTSVEHRDVAEALKEHDGPSPEAEAHGAL